MAEVDIRTSEDGHERGKGNGRYAGSNVTERTAKAVTSASLVAALAGAAAIILPLLGLLGIASTVMAAVTSIAIGIGFVLSGAAVSARWKDILHDVGFERRQQADIGGGVTAEFLGGAAGIALGILALVGVYPAVLVPVAAIVFGATLIFASATQAELASLGRDTEHERRLSKSASRATAGTEVLAGIAASVLGILVLVDVTGGVPAMTLSHIAFLCVGVAMVLAGTTLGTRMVAVLRH